MRKRACHARILIPSSDDPDIFAQAFASLLYALEPNARRSLARYARRLDQNPKAPRGQSHARLLQAAEPWLRALRPEYRSALAELAEDISPPSLERFRPEMPSPFDFNRAFHISVSRRRH